MKPINVSYTNGVVLAIPSRYSVNPLCAVLNVRLTFVGQMMTDFVSTNPVESVTVNVIRYRVRPLKSCPVVGIWNVPLFTPVIGVPG